MTVAPTSYEWKEHRRSSWGNFRLARLGAEVEGGAGRNSEKTLRKNNIPTNNLK